MKKTRAEVIEILKSFDEGFNDDHFLCISNDDETLGKVADALTEPEESNVMFIDKDGMHPLEGNRNWIEDYPHENGKYQCRCYRCSELFFGHKRRVVCKLCATPTSGLPGPDFSGHGLSEKTMDIHSKPGTKVIFTGLHGYDSDRKHALKHLKPHHEYTVDHTEVHSFSTYVSLKEIEGRAFNSVHFIVSNSDSGQDEKPKTPLPGEEVGDNEIEAMARKIYPYPTGHDATVRGTQQALRQAFRNGVRRGLELITPHPPPSGWVSVEERLPEDMQAVIFFSLISIYGYYKKDRGFYSHKDFLFKANYWMPLPDKPDS